MRKAFLSVQILIICFMTLFVLVSCGDDFCGHRDADDDLQCDYCGEEYTDGKDIDDSTPCAHRDIDDNSLCDKCGVGYTDGQDSSDEHTHSYTEKNTDSKYLDKIADCENAATYFYSCSCGAKGTETFTYGAVNQHNYVSEICIACGDAIVYSEGLEFLPSYNNTYSVVGIGTCTDKDIFIPSTYAGVPVTSIDPLAFENCTDIVSVIIPDSVTSIAMLAFNNCSSLANITVDENNPNYKSIDGNLYSKDGKTLILYAAGKTEISFKIPYCVTTISELAFGGCTALTSVTIGNSLTSNSRFAFSGCTGLTSITVDENNPNYKSIDGNLYSKDGKTLIQYAIGKTETSFTIPDSVTNIGYDAFSYCTSLISVTIPDSITSICGGAFSGCTSLTSIAIPYSVTNNIGEDVFLGCTGLASITIDEKNPNYKSIDGNLYSKDGKRLIQYAIGKSDASFKIPDSVTTIGRVAFFGCDNLISVTIPNSVTYIGAGAFSDCTNLTIYCEAASQPDGWNSYFNSSNCPVVWGYKETN